MALPAPRPAPDPYARIDGFVASTRTALFVREADELLMIRPDKTMRVNSSGAAILAALYDRARRPSRDVLAELAVSFDIPTERLLEDTLALIDAVGAILNEDFTPRPALRQGLFDRGMVAFPTLGEIAVTYGCQNRCAFCYAASPQRGDEQPPMSAAEIVRVMERMFHEAHVPSLSFTGGEATLRPDLPDLIRHAAALGFRVNLITNGVRVADEDYARTLVDAGLASAQVSLEAADPGLHDRIVGRPGAHARTVEGVRVFRRLGIHVHTNTTLCGWNLDAAEDIVRFVGRDLGLATMSMNMVIRTGDALTGERVGVTYTEVAERLPALLDVAAAEGVRLVWYSPIPYCLFNPVLYGLGAKSCACIDGILSVDPTGQVLPCSSFEDGIGSLLERPFERIYKSRPAQYWRKKRFLPPVCEGCADADVCAGGCPLYWDAAGSFAEIPRPGSDDPEMWRRWHRRRVRSRSFGVRARTEAVR